MAKFTDSDRYGMYRTLDQDGPGPALMGAHTLLGNDVVNGQDESLGDIKEIMLDMRTGRVAYAVLAFGGFLGIREKLFAVPWQAMTLDTAQHRFVLDVPKDKLVHAPGFDKHHWPDMSDIQWQDKIHDFYGTEPYRETVGGPGVGSGMPGSGEYAARGEMGAGAASMGAGHAGSGVPGDVLPDTSDIGQRTGRTGAKGLASHGLYSRPLDISADDGSGSITHSTYREKDE
ncbi:MAG TPA: PRC-barrel domain-containing protein [Telluria sp.]|nr:PRC-barrel domain-containing protein [Telluria sp.]